MTAQDQGTASEHATGTEVELQFDTPELDTANRWLRSRSLDAPIQVQPRPERTQLDTYFDTASWDIYRSRYTLRIRRVGDAAEATLKAFGTVSEGARVRTEINQALATPDADLLRSKGPVSDRLRLVLQPVSAVRPLFTVETHRAPFALTQDGVVLASLTLDDATFTGVEACERLLRVEVEEARPGALTQLAPLVEAMRVACSLTPSVTSKFESGLRAAGLRPPPPAPGATGTDAIR